MQDHDCHFLELPKSPTTCTSPTHKWWLVEGICAICGRVRRTLYISDHIEGTRHDWHTEAKVFTYAPEPLTVEVYSLRGDLDLAGRPTEDM